MEKCLQKFERLFIIRTSFGPYSMESVSSGPAHLLLSFPQAAQPNRPNLFQSPSPLSPCKASIGPTLATSRPSGHPDPCSVHLTRRLNTVRRGRPGYAFFTWDSIPFSIQAYRSRVSFALGDKIGSTPRLRVGTKIPLNRDQISLNLCPQDQTLATKNFSSCTSIQHHSSQLEHWRRTIVGHPHCHRGSAEPCRCRQHTS
jgi:hypothetical protein